MSWNERLIVAVKASVPHTRDTPSSTAIASPTVRSRRAARPRSR